MNQHVEFCLLILCHAYCCLCCICVGVCVASTATATAPALSICLFSFDMCRILCFVHDRFLYQHFSARGMYMCGLRSHAVLLETSFFSFLFSFDKNHVQLLLSCVRNLDFFLSFILSFFHPVS